MSVEFWNNKHLEASKQWLTGSRPAELIDYHHLSIDKSHSVLEIGVGTGSFTTWLAQHAGTLYITDISSIAIDKLANLASGYLIENLSLVPPVDIAICHLVFQHCTDDQVLHILNNLNLKPNGYFTFQFAELINSSCDSDALVADGSHYFRTVNQMLAIIEQTKFELVKTDGHRKYKWGQSRIDWHRFKCNVRKDDKKNENCIEIKTELKLDEDILFPINDCDEE